MNAEQKADLQTTLVRETSVPLWPVAARALGLGRTTAYAAAQRGDFPTNRVGRKITVPTAPLRRMLGFESDGGKGVPA